MTRRHYTEAETRNQFLCSCDDCCRQAAGSWTGLMDRVMGGEITLAEANVVQDRWTPDNVEEPA